MTESKRSRDVTVRIVEKFAKHPNQVVTVSMLSNALRLKPAKIRTAIN